MGESKSIQGLGLFNIPIGDRQWFEEHVGSGHHHHHHHHNHTSGTQGQKAKESEKTQNKK